MVQGCAGRGVILSLCHHDYGEDEGYPVILPAEEKTRGFQGL